MVEFVFEQPFTFFFGRLVGAIKMSENGDFWHFYIKMKYRKRGAPPIKKQSALAKKVCAKEMPLE
jgi:hypothetical protein